jgi:Protein of unknown function (DUF1569)
LNFIVDINDRDDLVCRLLLLEADRQPNWGKMKPRQMVEHLIDQLRYTNGKQNAYCELSAAEAEKNKKRAFESNAEFPRNIFLKVLPDQYEFISLEEAIKNLMKELEAFDSYFEDTRATAIHGSFGVMNHEEWVYWHGRHFYHHFKQFNLI